MEQTRQVCLLWPISRFQKVQQVQQKNLERLYNRVVGRLFGRSSQRWAQLGITASSHSKYCPADQNSVQRIFGYSNIFEYLLTNIFIRLNIRGFFLTEYIQTFTKDFFLLLNIFGHSFGLLDSNECIQMYSLNKKNLLCNTC